MKKRLNTKEKKYTKHTFLNYQLFWFVLVFQVLNFNYIFLK
nr:MAG TPA: hypothetical protein [Caudoviricetes sp.]